MEAEFDGNVWERKCMGIDGSGWELAMGGNGLEFSIGGDGWEFSMHGSLQWVEV